MCYCTDVRSLWFALILSVVGAEVASATLADPPCYVKVAEIGSWAEMSDEVRSHEQMLGSVLAAEGDAMSETIESTRHLFRWNEYGLTEEAARDRGRIQQVKALAKHQLALIFQRERFESSITADRTVLVAADYADSFSGVPGITMVQRRANNARAAEMVHRLPDDGIHKHFLKLYLAHIAEDHVSSPLLPLYLDALEPLVK